LGLGPGVAVFVWHPGYWGLSVGFYGGINYGFGYFGRGYDGGYWRRGRFFYNRAFNRVDDDEIHHVYYRDDDFGHRHWDRDRDRVSYNGGRGGIDARPTWDDMRARHERRMGPVREQFRHERMARSMPEERWSRNHGRPGIAATERPERFRGRGVERATRDGGPYRSQPNRDRARPENGRSQWHSFGDQPNGRRPAADPRYRDTQRGQNAWRDKQGGQRGNSGRDQMQQTQGGSRQQPDRRANREGNALNAQGSRYGRGTWQRAPTAQLSGRGIGRRGVLRPSEGSGACGRARAKAE